LVPQSVITLTSQPFPALCRTSSSCGIHFRVFDSLIRVASGLKIPPFCCATLFRALHLPDQEEAIRRKALSLAMHHSCFQIHEKKAIKAKGSDTTCTLAPTTCTRNSVSSAMWTLSGACAGRGCSSLRPILVGPGMQPFYPPYLLAGSNNYHRLHPRQQSQCSLKLLSITSFLGEEKGFQNSLRTSLLS
jgi:hypothetical protein